MRPTGKAECPSTTLDRFMHERGIDRIHAMKLDTQGAELNILRGSQTALKDCCLLFVETEFNTLYQGQPLFCDLDRFLRDQGFVLWRLNNLAHYSTGRVGGRPHVMLIGADPGEAQDVAISNGQLFWADGIYVKAAATAVSEEALDFDTAIAGAALACQLNLWDLALEMIRKSGDQALLTEAYRLLDSSFIETKPQHLSSSQFRSPLYSEEMPFGIETDFSVSDTCFIYGPYIRLPYGDFNVTFHFETIGLDENALNSPIEFDVAHDAARIAGITAVGEAGVALLKTGKVTIPFSNGAPKGLFEFRIWTYGRPFDGKLVFKGASVSP
jgi:hypothetical protein